MSISLTNSSAANTVTLREVTTAQGTPTAVVMPSSAKFLIALPPSTNTFPYRITNTTAEVGILCSSVGAQLFSPPGGSSFYFYTTAATTFVIRVLTY